MTRPEAQAAQAHHALLGTRTRRWLLVAALIAAFAAMLLAAHAYVSRRRLTASARSAPVKQVLPIGREFVTLTDVNLRSGPSVSYGSIGLAVKGSRGRILNVKNNWYEVQILEYARTKDDLNSADRGWLNSTYIETQPR